MSGGLIRFHGLDTSRCVTRSGVDVVWVGRATGFGAQAFSLGICHGGFVRDWGPLGLDVHAGGL